MRTRVRAVALVAAVLVGLAVAILALAHTPRVRRYALDRAIASVRERYGIQVEAEDLRYDIWALRIELAGVRAAAAGAAAAPFFAASRVSAQLPTSALFGPFAIESLAIEEARLRVVREAGGRTNLPQADGDGGAPAALRIGSLIVRSVAIELTDAETRTAVMLPAIDAALSGASGRIYLRQPGRIARGDVTTTVHDLRGGMAFDGRSLHLSNLTIRTDELTAAVSGSVAVLVDDPRLDLDVRGRGDADRLARWMGPGERPRGSIEARARVSGPLDAPAAAVTFASRQLAYGSLTVGDLDGTTTISPSALRIDRMTTRLAGGRVDLTGSVPFDQGDARIDVAWTSIDVESLAAAVGPVAGPRPTGRADGALAAHGPAGMLERWFAEGHLRISGGATAHDRAAVSGRVNVVVKNGDWRLGTPDNVSIGGIPVRATLGGRINVDAFEQTTIGGLVELPRLTAAQATEVLQRVGLVDAEIPPVDGTLEARATVSGRVSRPRVELIAEAGISDIASLSPDVPLHSPAFLDIRSDLHTAAVKVSLPALPALVEGTVQLTAPYVAQAQLTASGVALERLLQGVVTHPVSGTITATAHAAGPLARWREADLDVEVGSLDATVGALPVRLAAPARASLRAAMVDVQSLELTAGETRVSAVGRLPLTESYAGPADAGVVIKAAGGLGQFMAAVAATRTVDMPDMTGSGPAAVQARVTGSVARPRISADVELGPGAVHVAGLPPVTDLVVRVRSDGTRIDLRELRAEWQGATATASGSAPIDPATGTTQPGTLTGRVTSVTPRVLEPFVAADALAQIEGSIDATLQLEARSLALVDLSGEVRLDRMELRLADLPIAQREPTRVTVRNGFAEIATWQWAGQGGQAGLQGRVRLADRTAALIADGRFDLRMLTPFTRAAGVALAGTLEPRLSIVGPLAAPRVDGVIVVSGAEMRLREPRVVATDLEARMVLAGTSIHLAALSGTVNGGGLSGFGTASRASSGSADAVLNLKVASMALEFPEGLRSELDADLRVAGKAPDGGAPAGTISGSVTVLRSAYREPIAVATALLAAVRSRRLAAEAAPAEPSFVDTLALDVRVATGDADLIVDNNIGRLALAADLRVIGTVAAPALSGRAQIAEGGQLFLGRNRYEISAPGTVDFVSPVAIQPELNIVATTRVAGEEIQLTIIGPAEGPEVDAKSLTNPDLGQAEVFSLLLTGRRLNQISGDEAEIVGEQALAFLSGDVLGFASRAVGLDVIRLGGPDQAVAQDLTTEVDPTARLTFAKSVRRDIDVTFSQGLRDADAQTWIVDYRPRRQVEVRFINDDESLRSYAFRHDVAFGGGSAPSPAAAPQARAAPSRVSSVAITGARVMTQERLRAVLEIETGDEFDFGAWQRDRDRLEAILRKEGFCEARVGSHREGEGQVALSYSIAEGPVCAVDAHGYALDEATLDALRREWSEAVYDDFFIDEARAIVAGRLARDGYLFATIAVSLVNAPGRKTLEVRVETGPRASVRRVRFDGVEEPLHSALQVWASSGQAAAIAAEDPAGFTRAVTAWLRARGYTRATATVGAPLMEGSEAVVPVAVSAGPVFTVADVRVHGGEAVDVQPVLDASGLRAGIPFDPAAIEVARDRLQAAYRRDGFGAALVAAQPQIDEKAGTVAIVFAVTEGARQVLREVSVSGNRAIDTDVVTRALDLPVGEPVTLDDWLQARRRLFDTGLFRRADVTPEPLEGGAADGQQPMRARVAVQEWPAVRLRYGFEVAEERPEGEVTGRDIVPGVSADITRHTLFGRAITVGGALDYQRREQRGRAFLSSRTMLGRPVESVFVVERSRERFAGDFATDLTGASWEQRVRAWSDVQFAYSYRFERNRTFRTDLRPGDDIGFDITIKLAVLNATAAWDTRDDVADTSRGWLLSSSFDWAPAALGTDFRFVKHLAQAYYFRPWRGVVLASAARLGLAAPLDDQELVLSERYYAGGARTVRGAAEDSLGPRFALGDAAGGESLLVLNQEVRFPLIRWLQGVAFVDAGNVFADTSDVALGGLVTSYGAGLRLATPFALLRVDYGRLFSATEGQNRSGRWTFGIGHAF